jgi:hypothetical protein
MELSEPKRPLSGLTGVPVRDQAGHRLGRAFEFRGRWQPDGTIVLDELLVGRRALIERLRGPSARSRGIPWASVISVSRDEIVVHR